MNQGMIERAQERMPGGRPVTVHLAVDVWTDQCNTNTSLFIESMFINHTKDFGLRWLGTDFKRVDDPSRKQQQRSLFSEDE
jgi:hypothetical protein